MKIKIENFGPVKQFIFDTDKSFHLIVGDNNVGKSYALTVFYFTIKTLLEFCNPALSNRRMFYFGHYSEDEDDSHPEFEKLASLLKDKKTGDVIIPGIYENIAKEFLQNTFVDEFSKRIKSSYFENSSIVNSYSDAQYATITLSIKNLDIVLRGNIDEFKVVQVKFDYVPKVRFSKQNRTDVVSGKNLIIYKHTQEKIEETFLKIKTTCVRRLFLALSEAAEKIIDVDYLPASRSGLYQALSAFGLIIAELSKSRSFLSSRIELPGISGQLSDYFIKLSNIQGGATENPQFEELAAKIESDVLKGRIEYDFDEKKLYYFPERTDLRLDISTASSMISETAPVVAYIRHIIAWDSNELRIRRRRPRMAKPQALSKILIIEEPEAHLHPANQLKMTRYYAELARIGVVVIMTSHSNYIFNKASNLVLEGVLDHNQVKCDLFVMTESGSVGQSQVVDSLGIADDNFGDTSEELLNERMELLGRSV